MPFSETIRLALESLRANKLRSALTLVGMAIGVFSVIASVTAVDVLDSSFKENLTGLGANTITVERMRDNMTGERKGKPLPYEQALRLRDRMTLASSVSPSLYRGSTTVQGAGETTEPSVVVVGTDGDFFTNNGYEVEEGRFLIDGDERYSRPVVVLGKTLVEGLFAGREPLGQTVRIDGRRYTVVGTGAEISGGLGGDRNNRVYIPITRMISTYGIDEWDVEIDIRARSATAITALEAEAIGHLRAIRRLPPEEDNDFEISSNEAIAASFDKFASALTMGGLGIGLIALLAAGVGVMNIMLVSVTERTREIGVRKSLGATRAHIRMQFLVEAVVLCQVGGIGGILLGVAAGNLAAALMKSTPAFPLGWAFGALAGVTVVALVFGVYPAAKAAKLRPVDALRSE